MPMVDDDVHFSNTDSITAAVIAAEDQGAEIQRLKRAVADKDAQLANKDMEIAKLKDLLMMSWKRTDT